MRFLACWLGFFAVVCFAGCYPINKRLQPHDPATDYRYDNLTQTDPKNSEETFVVLTFSGGGTRAAALSYGVLKELRCTALPDGRTLLDEVDVISSVSGGSFTAAYLGLFGQEGLFADFPKEVLQRKIERDLALRVLAPWNWPRLLSPRFGRSDLADEYYDAHIFQHRHFGDLPKKRPFLILNATDIVRGAQFSFTQDYFDALCSDLSGVHVSRGVTASSAFPIAFTPLTLKNYGKDGCESYTTPEWVVSGEEDLDSNPQQYDLAKTWRSYEDAGRRRFIHLSDGGLADNIGLRAIETAIISTRTINVYEKVFDGTMKRLVVIAVDAKPRSESCQDRSARPPGILTVLNAAATNPMENYSSDTVERVRLWFNEWDKAAIDYDARRSGCEELAAGLCEGKRAPSCEETQREECYKRFNATGALAPPHPDLSLVHLRFESISDADVRKKLQGIGTRLQLDKSDVDLVVHWGRQLLRQSQPYRDLLEALKAKRLDGSEPGAEVCRE